MHCGTLILPTVRRANLKTAPYLCLAHNIYLVFDGKLTAQSSAFCSVTDITCMLPYNKASLACIFLVKMLVATQLSIVRKPFSKIVVFSIIHQTCKFVNHFENICPHFPSLCQICHQSALFYPRCLKNAKKCSIINRVHKPLDAIVQKTDQVLLESTFRSAQLVLCFKIINMHLLQRMSI